MNCLSQNPPPELCSAGNIAHLVFNTINSACGTISMSRVIADLLQVHFQSRDTHFTALRATPLYLLLQDPIESSYPVLEWSETDGSQNIAIFYMDHEEECVSCNLSWLMHSIIPTNSKEEQLRLNWSVSDTTHISELFGLAQHLLGLLQWSHEDILNIYCHQNFDDTFTEYPSV